MSCACSNRRWRAASAWVAAAALIAGGRHAAAAETSDPSPVSKTVLVLALDAREPLAVRTKSLASPPAISIDFPGQQVVSTLPERSVINRGPVEAVEAKYARGVSSRRALQSLVITLSAAYPYRVRSEPGRITVEVEHPASVRSASIEVGLLGGAVVGGHAASTVSERFRAMQQALAKATPTEWTLDLSDAATGRPPAPKGAGPESRFRPASLAAAAAMAHSAQAQAPRPRGEPVRGSGVPLWLLGLGLLVVGAAGTWLFSAGGTRTRLWARPSTSGQHARVPSGVLFIDQLVWGAFERQGYQLIASTEQFQPLGGTFRLIIKDGAKSALSFVGNGPFFEKQTVARFIAAMQEARLGQGFLVASGSFTVPAQRLAKDHGVVLIGREQLVELLSSGASSEYFARQLEQTHAQLFEAKETLRQYASELDMLRRQRNEASWFLGEERAKSGKLEAELEAMTQEIRRHEAELKRWEHEVTALRKQWEESQWYLGEAKAKGQYLEDQLSQAQGQVAAAAQSLERTLDSVTQQMQDAATRETALRDQLDQLAQEVEALRRYGERRGGARIRVPEAGIELWDLEGQLLAAGPSRDLSAGGIGCDTPGSVPELTPLRMRLSLPGGGSVESGIELVWQRGSGVEGEGFRGGFRFVEPSDAARAAIEETIERQCKSDAPPSE